MEEKILIAHVDAQQQIHPLAEHAEGVAKLCRHFCSQINKDWGDVGEILGLLHDYGKAQNSFQQYIRHATGLSSTGPDRAPHSIAGAILAYERYAEDNKALAQTLAYCISGHHRGLYDSADLHNARMNADNQSYDRQARSDAPDTYEAIDSRLQGFSDLPNLMDDIYEEDRPLFVRMLFSALVDADFLDTEAFMEKRQNQLRREISSSGSQGLWEMLRAKLRMRTDSFAATTDINKARANFLAQCRAHGQNNDKGIYSLFLPTGAGKTLSSMAWALEAAFKHNASRIIYVIPYTSIITQTAEVFREIFGEEYILEHHSEVSFDDDCEERESRIKLLAENWDAPIVITTNVQMFESLYAHRTSRCRKLHNICNAVIVFDEVQMFPAGYLNPMLRAIESLYACFEANILLCTATQPVFNEHIQVAGMQASHFYPIEATDITDIVPYEPHLFSIFDRVAYHLPILDLSMEELASRLAEHDTALCIVDTRACAGDLYKAIVGLGRTQEEVIHLSRNMCSLHLMEQIARIKDRLAQGLPTLVVSTQLIEAGVDLDFPNVYRSHSGLDSIIQAGGRCNREGKLDRGHVYIFNLTRGAGLEAVEEDGQCTANGITNHRWDKYKCCGNAAQCAANSIYRTLSDNDLNPNDPDIIRQYYKLFYGSIKSFDQGKIENCLWSLAGKRDLELDFESASRNFRLIDDGDMIDIYVPYGLEGESIINILNKDFVSRKDFRTLQRLRVGTRRREVEALDKQGVLTKVSIGKMELLLLSYDRYYCPSRGLLSDDLWTDEILTK